MTQRESVAIWSTCACAWLLVGFLLTAAARILEWPRAMQASRDVFFMGFAGAAISGCGIQAFLRHYKPGNGAREAFYLLAFLHGVGVVAFAGLQALEGRPWITPGLPHPYGLAVGVGFLLAIRARATP